MSSKKFRPIILAGGSGKRLWPLSTKQRPKQFISLFGDLSLFDLTLQRINNRDLFKKPIIVTSEEYLSLVEESLSKTGLEVERVILEPESKNTFSALALPVLASIKQNQEERYMVLPSDHYIPLNKSFYETCTNIKNLFRKEALTLLGVLPDSPSTEYGYISIKPSNDELKYVKSFIEKPKLDKAKQLLKQPDTLWNSGIFCFDGKWLTNSIKTKEPDMYSLMLELLPNSELNQIYFYPEKQKFSKLKDISFDKAIVESNEHNYVAILDAGWTDLGSWYSLSNLQKNPEHGLTLYTEGDYPRTEKPWGYFEVLLETQFSKVKILSIDAGQMLSMQMHEHRSETWYVTQGIATVTKGDTTLELYAGESVVIDKKEKHRLQNFGNEVLEIIEIQTGTYFGEDDIVRFEDIYERKDFH
ncbi:sugar phosphate nucleotidyltransferase [Gammaproteobacteria bacterium]|nr:sugar phosphate nucleotidyltransferase [Gammaproteobacteria bacterium]